MPRAHDPPVGGTGLRILAVELANGLREQRHELLQHAGRAHDVVRGHAGLPGVDQLGPGQAPGGCGEIDGVVDPHGRLAAELQRHGREVLGCGPHDHAPHGRVAGEEEVVEAVLQQPRGLRDTALDHAHAVGQLLLQGPAQRLGHVRGVLGGLDHRGVPGRERAHQRRQQQLHRVVPRSDDQHGAQGLRLDPAAGGTQHRSRSHGPRRHPGGQAATDVAQLGERHADLGELGLGLRLAQVLGQRRLQRLTVPGQHALEPVQALQPQLERRRGAEGRLSALHEAIDLPGAVCGQILDRAELRLAPPERRGRGQGLGLGASLGHRSTVEALPDSTASCLRAARAPRAAPRSRHRRSRGSAGSPPAARGRRR